MKRILCIIFSFMITIVFSACTDGSEASSATDDPTSQTEVSVDPTASSVKTITSLNYKNTGKMGDTDGPAFAVYSKIGYSGASVDLNLADMEIQTLLPDGRFVNGYMFLGADVYQDGSWINCFDAGLCWSGKSGGWHIFYNIYETVNADTSSWYESSKKLPKNGTYTLTLTLIEDQRALLTVKGNSNNFKDSVEIEIKGAEKDGSNTSFLFNTALDFPADTKVDINGEPSEDWPTVTLANSDKGICLRKLHATDLKLYKNEAWEDWTDAKNSAQSIWPDKAVFGFDYSPTEVFLYDGREYFINLDMNRK